ncbi:MAG: lysine--tRNA ligase [Deltaproteobacteria bacterium]|nr:lysine--tRNA ligase [Deltaproteobacteria bacterium]
MNQENENSLRQQRIKKLEELRALGVNPFANDFTPSSTAIAVFDEYDKMEAEILAENAPAVSIAGRIVSLRLFGKAAFMHLQDRSGKLQAYIRKNLVGDENYKVFKLLDIGDTVGISGTVFKTRTGELTVQADSIKLLTKSLRPLPEKWHGLKDIETRYRQRYVDLIVNQEVRDTFIKRTAIIETIREFFKKRDFLEVETPMMQAVAGGATARPFTTHHNALDLDLNLRIAPELYLKRLVVGGFERVFEINRNFRNEGISIKHNPEFTMIEFYQAYATYLDLMSMTEELFTAVCQTINNSETIVYQGQEISFAAPWDHLTVIEAIEKYADINAKELDSHESTLAVIDRLKLEMAPQDRASHAKCLMKLFDEKVEEQLIQPTFITDYPVAISPLSRRNDANPEVVDRFELFIAGREMANAFSELNDPLDQRERFEQQLKEKAAGDLEAHQFDADYLRALEYGLPPTAGEGIGIDRMVMLFTDSASIRDVILFPLLKPEQKA